jgi:hypothetical protein
MNEEKREVFERENSWRINRHAKNALHSFYRWAVDRHGTGDYQLRLLKSGKVTYLLCLVWW